MWKDRKTKIRRRASHARFHRALARGTFRPPWTPGSRSGFHPSMHLPGQGESPDTPGRPLAGVGLRAPHTTPRVARALSGRRGSLAPLDPSLSAKTLRVSAGAQGGPAPLIALSPSSIAGRLR